MKIQIKRFSPHQNGKVFGVLMAASALVFAIPMFLLFLIFPMPVDSQGNAMGPSAVMFLIMPVLYLVLGYLTVAVGCLLYNFICKYTGGIEYEASGGDQTLN
ncbi:MAG TPA: hypothetical protein VGU61_14365 [Noviherbaspirillum sp.]|uniref:hypothetical protein n=1 Tax=Noviherbaspirillum sp. TaxID=1926288 RepID=UPI002DDCEC7A|nr:hypothetical protein [Noviherbaspirillum sp.]HEV2611450.1 hypothetical protein [Noviherbaspirillum sp.]